MLDWNDYRTQLMNQIGDFASASPDTVKGYQVLSSAAQKTNALDAKTRELIAMAVAITTRCDGCISVHSKRARDEGATNEEIAEALGVAVALNAGAALVYSSRALDAANAAAK